MRIIETVNSQRFSLDGIEYFKNYISEVAGNQITIFNAYDRKDVRVDWEHYGNIEVNGVVYGNSADLQSALLPVIYTRNSLAPSGSGVQTVNEEVPDIDGNVTIDGTNINVTNPVTATETTLNEALEDINDNVGGVPNLQAVTDVGNSITDGTDINTITASFINLADGLVETLFNKYGVHITSFLTSEETVLNNSELYFSNGVDVTRYQKDVIIINGTDYPLPTGASSPIATLADITGGGYTVISSNTTASNDTNYTVVANATFTDPSPTEGKGYVVYVRNGTATIGGTGYAVGSLVFRVFHSGSWNSVNFGLKENAITAGTTGQYYRGDKTFQTLNVAAVSGLQTELNKKDVLPVIYEKHANVPAFGSPALNNLEGVALLAAAVARSFADTNTYTRRQRVGLTIATTGNTAQARQLITYFNRKSNLNIIIGVGFAENCTNPNVRAFAGVSTTTFFTNVEPTALLNCIGLAKLTTSNNLHLIHNDDSGTATAIDLGVNFPSNTVETDFYILELTTNGSNVDYVVTRVNTGDTAIGTLTTDLPSTSTALNVGLYVVQNTGANTTTGIDFFGSNIIKW